MPTTFIKILRTDTGNFSSTEMAAVEESFLLDTRESTVELWERREELFLKIKNFHKTDIFTILKIKQSSSMFLCPAYFLFSIGDHILTYIFAMIRSLSYFPSIWIIWYLTLACTAALI